MVVRQQPVEALCEQVEGGWFISYRANDMASMSSRETGFLYPSVRLLIHFCRGPGMPFSGDLFVGEQELRRSQGIINPSPGG